MSDTPKAFAALDAASVRPMRRQFRQLIDQLRALKLQREAQHCMRWAVEIGLWLRPDQRPTDFDPGLLAQPQHDAGAFAVCAQLEASYGVIMEDLRRGDDSGFSPVEEQLTSQGIWDEVVFYEQGLRHASAAARFPRIAAVLDALPVEVRQCGVIMLSRIAPGTHIMAHCGDTNCHLRLHLGLVTNRQALLRVADRYIEWEPGKCIVFDDSFEHEVWNLGQEDRLVLLVDIPHPQAPPHKLAETGGSAALRERLCEFLRERGLASVHVDPDGTVGLRPDIFHERLVRRLLAELGRSEVRTDDV